MMFRFSLLLVLATASLQAEAQEAPKVRTATVAKPTETSLYEVPGRTEPIEATTIFTRATGIIRERRFEIGDTVKSGEVLAIVDAPEIDRAVEAAQASVEQATARAANAASLSARSSQLLKSHVVSAEESEQRTTTSVEAAAAVRVAKAELARLVEQQRFLTVHAPFDAVISARNFDRGDLVRGDAAPADGWLYKLNRLDTLRFVISATPDLALKLTPDSRATVHFGEFPGMDFPARVAYSSRLFDAASGTMRTELLLENKDLAIPGGLTGMASFKVRPTKGTYLVPTNALILRQGKTMVATVVEKKAHFLEVHPGRNFGRNVEIASSQLADTTVVILNPNALLREGDPVASSPLALN